jgi:hypothetical protein
MADREPQISFVTCVMLVGAIITTTWLLSTVLK